MPFAQPQMFHYVWLVLLAGALLFFQLKRKDAVRHKFASSQLFSKIAGNLIKKNETLKVVLIILAGLFSVLALMRPQWGFEWQEVKREGLDILVAIDTSKSMLADDVKPNRLERSKLAVKDLVKKLKGDRIGLIAFSGTGFLVCPLTIDYRGFLLTLDGVNFQTIPQGGTALASAINEARRSFKDTPGKYKSLIIITDGEDFEGDVQKAAKEAKNEGIKIFTIGIGTTEGELIRYKDEYGQFQFLKDKDGNFVKSRLNEKILEEMAILTDGAYVRSSGAQFGLEYIYDQKLSTLEKQEFKSTMEKRFYERFQIPLFVAFLMLCAATLLPARKS